MNCRFADFRCKEVINICDGCRLGYVGDVECRLPDGQLTALIIPGPYRFFGLFGRGEEYCIPWECIKQIGDDIILIDKPFPRQEIPRREHRTRRRRYLKGGRTKSPPIADLPHYKDFRHFCKPKF